jgi:hypothetical protein
MSVIYKYPVLYNQEKDKMYVEVPEFAQPISIVVESANIAFIYYIADKEEGSTKVQKEVLWIGTGWYLKQETREKMNSYKFLGTHKVEDLKNNLIWHFWVEP